MRRNWSSGMTRTQSKEYTNKKPTNGRTNSDDKLGVCPAHPLIPILTKFGVWGGLSGLFVKFEF